MEKVLKAPTNEGWIVVWIDEDGKTHPTNYVYKSKRFAQQKADELMLINQKEYHITKCIY